MRKLLSTLVAILVLLVIADRVAPVVAGGVLAKRIRTEASLRHDPRVTFHGFPFLTQAVAGRYDDVQVRADDVDAGRLHGIALDTHFEGLHLALSDVVSQHVDQVPVDLVTGTATVAYPDLVRAAELPSDVHIDSVTRQGEGLRVQATVMLAGRSLTASARAAVRLDGSALAVTVSRVTVDSLPAGLPTPGSLAGQLGFRVPLSGLPFGLRVTGARPGDEGISVSARARDVILADPNAGT